MYDVPGISEAVLWAIILCPLAAFTVITLYLRKLPKIASYLSILAIGASFVLALVTLVDVLGADGHIAIHSHEWFQAGPLELTLGVRIDGLTAVMLVVVTSVAFLVQVYSQGYMKGDPGYGRYYAYMSLFITSMLGLVLADNLFMLFIFWELVGLSSYLLIGFWFHKPSAAAAAKKAFIVTRIGDLGLLAAILLIWTRGGTFAIDEIHELVLTGALSATTVTLFALGLFAGAVGKSAQFPLHVWLPDAMEGPTPVSALIHAATMVAAGRLPDGALLPRHRRFPRCARGGRLDWRGDRHRRRRAGARADGPEARAGLLHHQPAGLHDAGAGRLRVRRRHLPPVHARLLQGAALPRQRLREPRHEHLRYAQDGRPAHDHADHLLDVPDRDAQPLRRLPAGGVLVEG